MTPLEFETRIVEWARQQPDVKALILGGSRAQGSTVDKMADWDFHLITTHPQKYFRTSWLTQIATLWCANSELTPRGVIKVSAVFEDGLEADFVPLKYWQMKLVYWGMQHPEWASLMPSRLRRGILESRSFLVGSGYRVLIGGQEWESRLAVLKIHWQGNQISAMEFDRHVSAFWQKAVWVVKKIVRPEPRSAIHWLHKLLVDHVYTLLAEEARLAGRAARPEARKAEKWLDARRLAQTEIETSLDQRVLARALLSQMTLFEEVCRSVADSRNFALPDYSAVAGWLRQELTKLLSEP